MLFLCLLSGSVMNKCDKGFPIVVNLCGLLGLFPEPIMSDPPSLHKRQGDKSDYTQVVRCISIWGRHRGTASCVIARSAFCDACPELVEGKQSPNTGEEIASLHSQ